MTEPATRKWEPFGDTLGIPQAEMPARKHTRAIPSGARNGMPERKPYYYRARQASRDAITALRTAVIKAGGELPDDWLCAHCGGPVNEHTLEAVAGCWIQLRDDRSSAEYARRAREWLLHR